MLQKWVWDRLDLCCLPRHLRCRCRCRSVCFTQYKSIELFQAAMLALPLLLGVAIPLSLTVVVTDTRLKMLHASRACFRERTDFYIYTNCGDYSRSFPHYDNRNLEDLLHCFRRRINGPVRPPACSLPHGM